MSLMDRETELALVARLRAGDEAAFDAVYEAYRAPLFTFLRRLGRRRELAEDLLEETWLRLVAGARALRPDTRLAAWLFTIARNLYASHCRARLPIEARTTELVDLWPVADAGPSPAELAEAGELAERVERALARLPLRHREVLLRVAGAGLAPAEAAITLRADNDVAVAGETAQQVVKMIDMLEDLDDVQNVYHNAELGADAYT